MEKEEKTWVKEKVEEEEEEEEEEEYNTLLKARKSRIEKGDVESIQNEVKDGISERNEHVNQSMLIANLAKNGMKGLDGVLGEFAEGQQKQENLVFLDKVEGVEFNSGEKQMEENPPELGESEIVSQKLLVHTSESNSNVQGNSANYKYSISEIESTESDLMHEDELEETKVDVERVLQKQMTHDLYCPNCNSCITRRVILRKRKRRVQLSDEDFKRNKTVSAAVSKSGTCSAQASDDELAEDDAGRETGSVLYRCLSCFSLFIPTGNGSKLFWIFGEKNGKENVRNEQVPLPNIKKKWFASNNQERIVEQVRKVYEHQSAYKVHCHIWSHRFCLKATMTVLNYFSNLFIENLSHKEIVFRQERKYCRSNPHYLI